MLQRIKHMLIKEFIQLLRDPKMRPIIFVMPVMQLLVFGYAATLDVRDVPLAVYDSDNSVISRELVSRFVSSGYFKVVRHVWTDAQARDVIDRGEAAVVLRVDHGFGADVSAGKPATVQMLLDGTDSNTARIALGYGTRIVAGLSRQMLLERLDVTGSRLPSPLSVQTRAWFNADLQSRDYYVPGVVALITLISTLMLTSMAIVREKEIGTMEQIIVTPIRPSEFILGKSVPFALIGFFDMVLVSVVAAAWFEVPIRGSLLLLAGATVLYLMTAIGIGLLISTIARTQQQALMTTFFVAFPAVLLSGFMFPIANMPTVVQWMTYPNPMRYFLVIIRGLFLKGVGLEILWPHMLALAIIGTLTLWLSARRLHKRIS